MTIKRIPKIMEVEGAAGLHSSFFFNLIEALRDSMERDTETVSLLAAGLFLHHFATLLMAMVGGGVCSVFRFIRMEEA